jgi:hypothetical protein
VGTMVVHKVLWKLHVLTGVYMYKAQEFVSKSRVGGSIVGTCSAQSIMELTHLGAKHRNLYQRGLVGAVWERLVNTVWKLFTGYNAQEFVSKGVGGSSVGTRVVQKVLWKLFTWVQITGICTEGGW